MANDIDRDNTKEEFKKDFLGWANANPDGVDDLESMPEHLEAYKKSLSIDEIRRAILELENTNETIRQFRKAVARAFAFDLAFEYPDENSKYINCLPKCVSKSAIKVFENIAEKAGKRNLEEDEELVVRFLHLATLVKNDMTGNSETPLSIKDLIEETTEKTGEENLENTSDDIPTLD